jgi:sugar phosphate isomerase/epimerase
MRSNTEGSALSRREFIVGSAAAAAAAVTLASRASMAQEAGKKWQIGCYTRPWSAFEYPIALDAITEAGFRYVGLMTTKSPNSLVISEKTTPDEAAKIGEECKKRGLAIPSVYGGGFPMDTPEAAVAGMKRLIDNCAAAGAKNLMMGGVGKEDEHERYYKAVAQSCDYAAEKGIGISVKPHGGLNATGPQCRKTIEFVGNKNFRLWYDPGNIFYYSDAALDPVNDAKTVDGLVVGMSVKDFQRPKVVDLTPGTGMVDFPKVMERLKQGGFTSGPLIIECLKPGDLPQLLIEAKKAREFVENLVGEKA